VGRGEKLGECKVSRMCSIRGRQSSISALREDWFAVAYGREKDLMSLVYLILGGGFSIVGSTGG